jgi:hypothetical protein
MNLAGFIFQIEQGFNRDKVRKTRLSIVINGAESLCLMIGVTLIEGG